MCFIWWIISWLLYEKNNNYYMLLVPRIFQSFIKFYFNNLTVYTFLIQFLFDHHFNIFVLWWLIIHFNILLTFTDSLQQIFIHWSLQNHVHLWLNINFSNVFYFNIILNTITDVLHSMIISSYFLTMDTLVIYLSIVGALSKGNIR